MTQNQGATPPQPKVPLPPRFAASSTPIIVGVVFLIIGQAIFQAGQQVALEAALDPWPTDDGSSQILVGAVVSIIGLIAVLIGVARLCRRIDFLHRKAGGVS